MWCNDRCIILYISFSWKSVNTFDKQGFLETIEPRVVRRAIVELQWCAYMCIYIHMWRNSIFPLLKIVDPCGCFIGIFSCVYLMENEFSVFFPYDPEILSLLVCQQEYHPSFIHESHSCHVCDWTFNMREKKIELDSYNHIEFLELIEEDMKMSM